MIARLICFLRVSWKRKNHLNSYYCNSSWKRLGQKMSKKKLKEKKIQKEVWKLVGGQHLGWSIRWRLTFFVLILIFPQKLSIGSFSSSLLLLQKLFSFDWTFLLHTSCVKTKLNRNSSFPFKNDTYDLFLLANFCQWKQHMLLCFMTRKIHASLLHTY